MFAKVLSQGSSHENMKAVSCKVEVYVLLLLSCLIFAVGLCLCYTTE